MSSLYTTNFDLSTIRWFAGTAGSEAQVTAFNGKSTFTANVRHGSNVAPTYYSVYAKAINICSGLEEQATRPLPPPQYDYSAQSSAGGLVLLVDNHPSCYPNRPGKKDARPSSTIAAYPNPANGSLLVRLEAFDGKTSGTEIQLFNGQGRLVRQQKVHEAQCSFITADLPAGI